MPPETATPAPTGTRVDGRAQPVSDDPTRSPSATDVLTDAEGVVQLLATVDLLGR